MIKGKHLYGFYKLLDRFRCICRISWIIYTWLNTIIFEVSDVLVNNKRKSKPPKTKNIGKKKREAQRQFFSYSWYAPIYTLAYTLALRFKDDKPRYYRQDTAYGR